MTVTASAPQFWPADYVTRADVYRCPGCSGLDDEPDVVDRAITEATEVMWAATGRQFTGVVSETIRPCCSSDLCGLPDSLWAESGYRTVPAIVQGTWYNLGGSVSLRRCVTYDCLQMYGRLDLYAYPVLTAAVKIDGVPLAPAVFRIDENRWLTRTDGLLWPVSQNVLLDDTQPGTWTVTFTHGQAPPSVVKTATARLACELVKATTPEASCSLPKSILTVNRQGITYQLPSVIDIVSKQRTGIYEIDMAIQTVNPNGLQARPRIASPDRPVGPHRHVG